MSYRYIGGHELIDAYMMFNGLSNIKKYPTLFTSDELAHYRTVLVDLYHRESQFHELGEGVDLVNQ
jgi:hypothetical protein